MRALFPLSLLLALTACKQSYIILEPIEDGLDETTDDLPDDGDTTVDETTDDTDSTTDETTDSTTQDFSEYDGATLVILSPSSGDFLLWEQSQEFSAAIYDVDGEPLDFDGITWTSDVDDGWDREGSAFSDDSLDVGTHALTATAELPNGDRLVYTIGGVLVQSEYAGTYTGSVDIEGAYTGYAIGCSGAALLYIDAYGEEAWGDASCLISVLGFDLDMAFLFDLENDYGDLNGDASVDISGWFEWPFEMDADLTEEGDVSSEFEIEYGDLAVSGGMDLTRLSRETQEP